MSTLGIGQTKIALEQKHGTTVVAAIAWRGVTQDMLHSRTTIHYSNQAGCISNGSQRRPTTCLLFCNVSTEVYEFNSTMWTIHCTVYACIIISFSYSLVKFEASTNERRPLVGDLHGGLVHDMPPRRYSHGDYYTRVNLTNS